MLFKDNIKKNKGFIILISVIVVSVILTLSIGILNITLRELILANIEKESLKAFYAADAGVDCVFHHDVLSPNTYSSPLSPSSKWPLDGTTVDCMGASLHVGPYGTAGYTDTGYTIVGDEHVTYLGNIAIGNGTCATVLIRKKRETAFEESTVIEARGYNTCDTNHPRRVERALRLSWGEKT